MAFGGFKKEEGEKTVENTSSTSTTAAQTAAAAASGQKPNAFLGKGSKVVGTLTFTGPVELDGHVEGEVIAQDRLTIGESAQINAKVSGAEIVVRGTVHGDIIASQKLSLRKPAKVVGNISSASLSIEEGVSFEGKCSMSITGASTSTSSSTENKGGSSSKTFPSSSYGSDKSEKSVSA